MHHRIVLATGVALMCSAMLASAQEAAMNTAKPQPGIAPLMRATLWWLPADITDWTDAQLEEVIQAQHDVGFNMLWVLNAASFPAADGQKDVLERVYSLADARKMKVIIDLPQGGWYGKNTPEALISTSSAAIQDLHRRYGQHPSFYGWYLNYEINPLPPDDTEETAHWRHVWKVITDECHRVAPESVVTISPFFLLDDISRRGFVYLTPEQYAGWWGTTLKETGIDVIMLQDSGEHLAFFTLEQREPFWAAMAKSAREAGAEFWLNIETGEQDVADWEEFLAAENPSKLPWRFTPIDWLEAKLRLAAKHADNIVNWGYFPFMDPHRLDDAGAFAGGEFGGTHQQARDAYEAYRAYYLRVRDEMTKASPVESGTE